MIGDRLRSCCALRMLIRELREGIGDLFTCDKCGRAYRKDGWLWREVSVVDEINEMNAEQRGG